jgi:hypothetical protein
MPTINPDVNALAEENLAPMVMPGEGGGSEHPLGNPLQQIAAYRRCLTEAAQVCAAASEQMQAITLMCDALALRSVSPADCLDALTVFTEVMRTTVDARRLVDKSYLYAEAVLLNKPTDIANTHTAPPA